VQARPPVWTMTRLCPVCEQGTCLVFVVCPGCGRLAVHCDEEGSAFLDPRDVTSHSAMDPRGTKCPGCGEHLVADFTLATDTKIRAAGFTTAEYE
jgi:hypothetical protein